MAVQNEVIEETVKSFLIQVQTESAILDRIIYKNKNQHRRSSYFQYLLKVRRNLKLLHSVHVDELIDSCFIVISGRKGKQKANLLETLKRRKHDNGNFNFLERLLGAARLLSEMVEPILKTAIEISTLLARSFFMGFSLMVLALLARLRVLVQQILLDVVTLFNQVSSIAQNKQSIKITQDGVEVFREYYPTMEEIVTLECVWKTDKFVLKETVCKCETEHQEGSPEGKTPARKPVQYYSVEAFLGGKNMSLLGPVSKVVAAPWVWLEQQNFPHPTQVGSQGDLLTKAVIEDELDVGMADAQNNGEETVSNLKRKQPESPSNEQLHNSEGTEDVILPPTKTVALEGSSTTPPILNQLQSNSVPNRRVAFVSIKTQARAEVQAQLASTSQANESESKRHDNKDIPLFDLFNTGHTKGSIF